MTVIYILFALFATAYSFVPKCSTCKFFVPNNDNPDLGLCNMFQDKIYNKDNNVLVKNMAAHCRKDENQCGESGHLYESKSNPTDKDVEPIESYEYIKNACSGKFVDEDDLTKLEQLELDMVITFQKMRRHNKKIIYKNVKNIYKLFKKKDYDM
jgi:hypothetical protein